MAWRRVVQKDAKTVDLTAGQMVEQRVGKRAHHWVGARAARWVYCLAGNSVVSMVLHLAVRTAVLTVDELADLMVVRLAENSALKRVATRAE